MKRSSPAFSRKKIIKSIARKALLEDGFYSKILSREMVIKWSLSILKARITIYLIYSLVHLYYRNEERNELPRC
jgi:hypothetical protein